MKNSKVSKQKKCLIFSLMLSCFMALFACVLYMLPSNIQATTEQISAEGIETSNSLDISEISDKWEDVETNPLTITGNKLEISSSSDLVEFAEDVNSGSTYSGYTVYLTRNIELSGKIWTPIGSSSSRSFQGTFDGRGYKITGLTINDTIESNNQGLFGNVSGSAIIRNLFLEGVNISSNAQYVGGLVARSSSSAQVINCGASGYIYNNYSSTGHVGGLVGYSSGTGIYRSFSTVAININNSSSNVGGLCGYFSASSSAKVEQCFYYSESGISGGRNIGFIGTSSSSSSIYIDDVYTSSSKIIGSPSTYGSSRVGNSSLWATDTTGIMHDVRGMRILKGVGNVYIETEIYKYNPDRGREESTDDGVYIYSIISQRSVGDTSYYAGTNFNFPVIEVTRNTAESRYNSDVLATESSTSSGIFFNSGDGGSLNYTNQNHFTGSNSEFEIEIGGISGHDAGVKNSADDYTLYAGNIASYYQVTLHSRGSWKLVNFNLYEYEDVGASRTTYSDNFTTDINVTPTYESLYGIANVSALAYYGTSNQSSRRVYVPYGEYYQISFRCSSYGGISYIDMMTGWGGTVSSGSVKRITSPVNLSGIYSITDLPIMGREYSSKSAVSSSTTVNFYFNNIQQVELDLYDYNSTLYHEISGTYPVFVNDRYTTSSSSSKAGTLSINVMANQSLSSKGFSIGNISSGSGAVYAFSGTNATFSSLGRNGQFVPYWAEFCLNGFYLNSRKIIDNSTVSDGAAYGTNLNATLSCDNYVWNFEADDVQTLYARWLPYRDSTTLEFGFTDDENQHSTYTPGEAYTEKFIQNNTTDFYTITSSETTEVSREGLTSSLTRQSDQSVVFKFVVNHGYQLNPDGPLTLDLTYDSDDLTVPLNGFNGSYAGSSGSNVYIANNIQIDYDTSTGEVTVSFNHLMGIFCITFEIVPKIYNITFGAGIDDVLNPTSEHDLISVTLENTTYQLKTSSRERYLYAYGSEMIFENVFQREGYTFNGIVNVYLDDVLTTTLFAVRSEGTSVTISSLDWTVAVQETQSIHFEFVVTRNYGTLIINFEGLDPIYLTDEYVVRSISGIDISNGLSVISTLASTDSTIRLNVQLTGAESFASITSVDYDLSNSRATVAGLPQGEVSNFTLSLQDLIMETDDIITINVKFSVIDATVEVVRQDVRNDELLSTEVLVSDKVLTYGFVIRKLLNNPTLQFVDRNENSNNFNIEIDYSSSAVASIKIYRDGTEIADITNNSALQTTITGFSKGANIQFVIEYEQMTSQVQVGRVRIPKGSSTISGVEVIQSKEYSVGEQIPLSDNNPPQGYTLLGWFYVGGDNIINLNNLTYSDLLPYDVGSIKILAPSAEGHYQSEIKIQKYMYFVAVYEAIDYALVFDTSSILDDVQNEYYNVIPSNNNTLIIEYNTSVVQGGDIPTAALEDNDMLRFVGWQNTDIGIYLTYNDYNTSFSVTASWKSPPTQYEIVLKPIFEPKVVTLYYCNENGDRTGETVTVVYGTTPTTALRVPSARIGYTFCGWMYNDTLFYPYQDGAWGTFQNWTPMVLEADLIPYWDPISISITLHSGLGSFAGGVTTITANVDYETNVYIPNASLTDPVWEPQGATYEFAGYYKAIYNGKSYYFYDATDSRNTVCDFVTSEVVFYACYTLVSVDATMYVDGQPSASWVYDSKSYNIGISLPSSLPLVIQFGSETYFKDGQLATNIVKDVVQSGLYTCNFIVTSGETTVGDVRVITVGTINANAQVHVNISPKTVTISQNGVQTNVITKVFDNTVYVSNVVFNGFYAIDDVTGTIEYEDKNVGIDKKVIVTISGKHSTNYVCDEMVGEITPFVICFILSGSGYSVGEQDAKISIASQNISLESDSSRFLTQVGASPILVIRTSRNVAGIYTYGGDPNNIEVVDFDLKGNVDINNFTFIIQGQYELIDAGAENIVVQIRLLCDDADWVNVTSLGTLTVNGTYNEILDNGTQNVYLVDRKSNYELRPTINIILNRDANYWFDRVLVNGQDTQLNVSSISNVDNISYTINDFETNAIVIDIYITTLCDITLDYNLEEGESLVNSLPTTTGFAYQMTIQQSIDNYDAVLPNAQDVQRVGFVFTGWKLQLNNQDINTSTSWSYRGKATLVAQYELADIDAEFYADESLGEIVSNESSFEIIYDRTVHILKYLVTNQNDYAINYTYSWTRNSAQMANDLNYVSVINVPDSGEYTLTIRASSKRNSLINITRTFRLTVNIIPKGVFTSGYVITKQYDGTTATPIISILINGQNVEIVGAYVAKDVGNGLDTRLQMWTIDKVMANNSSLNYSLNFENVDMDLSVITPKDVTLAIGEPSKVYDGEVFTYYGTYTDQTPFDYTILSSDVNVGTYTQENDGLLISIFGDDISNFNITISGSLTITYLLLDVKWQGTTNLTFDANYHSIYPILPDYMTVTGITYSIEGKVMYEYSSLDENLGAKNGGVYIVSFTFDNENSNVVLNTGLNATLTINKRIIYLDYDGIFAEKVYDGTTDVFTTNAPNIYNNSALTELLSTVITEPSDMPQFEYSYVNQVAGENKNINVALVDSTNYLISESYNILLGNILKRDATLYIAAEKVYDGTESFIVDAEDISGQNLVDGDIISGYVEFMGVINCGSYYNLQAREKNISLNLGVYRYDTNYNISFVNSSEAEQDINYLTITKAQIVVSTDKNKQYEYSGEEVEITYSFVNLDNASVVPNAINVDFTYTTTNSDSVLDNGLAVQVGAYTFNMMLTGIDAQNFDISGDVSNIAFQITARRLVIQFLEDVVFEYSGESVTYKKDDGQTPENNEQIGVDRWILTSDSTLGVGDVLNWSFTTVSKDVGRYPIYNQDRIQRTLFVTKGYEDYSRNYLFSIDQNSAIVIEHQTINFNDIAFVEATSEYNALVKELAIQFYDRQQEKIVKFAYGDADVSFNNLSYVTTTGQSLNIISPNEVKYAGTYSFNLSFKNYLVANSEMMTYTITQSRIDLNIGELSKVYDGTLAFNNVTLYPTVPAGTEQVTNRAPYEGDEISVVALYSQKDVGQNIILTFALQSTNPLVSASYYINNQNYYGEITPKEITLDLQNTYITYYTGEEVVIGIENFFINSVPFDETNTGLVNNEIMQGNIVLPLVGAGSYELKDVDLQSVAFNINVFTYAQQTSLLSNYKITGMNGTVAIYPAQISAEISNTSKIYNGNIQEADIEYILRDGYGKLIENELASIITVNYINQNEEIIAPCDAGIYKIVISVPQDSNYRIVDDDGNAVLSYTSDLRLVIDKRDVAVNVNHIHAYDGKVAEYQIMPEDISDPTSTGDGGLIIGHELSGMFLTNDSIPSSYSVTNVSSDELDSLSPVHAQNLQVMILSSGKNVTSNYNIICTVIIVIAGQIENINSDNIKSIEYCAQDVTQLDTFSIKFTFGGEEYEVAYGQNLEFGSDFIATLGELSRHKGDGTVESISEAVDVGQYRLTLSITNSVDTNVNIEAYVDFAITLRKITQIEGNFNKYYDGSLSAIGPFTSKDIYESDLAGVNIQGYYMQNGSPMFGVGTYIINFVLDGNRSQNYQISLDSTILGTISKQPIILSLKDPVSLYYTGENATLQITEFNALKQDDQDVPIDSIIQSLAGTTIQITEVNAGEYSLASLFALNQVRTNFSGTTEILDNYDIVGYFGQLTIKACEIEISFGQLSTTYDAQEHNVPYTLSSLNGTIVEGDRPNIVTMLYNKEMTVPVNAGEYQITATISDDYKNNYIIVNGEQTGSQFDYGTFTILQREISINIGIKTLPYTGKQVVYNIQSEDIGKTEINSSGLIESHAILGYYITSGSEMLDEDGEAILYVVDGNPYNITLTGFDILQNGVSVLSNYCIISESGSIQIILADEGSIDRTHLDSLIYSATDYATTGDIRVSVGLDGMLVTFVYNQTNENGMLTNLTNSNGEPVTEAINAGIYHVYLTVNGTTIQNQEIEFTISPKQITSFIYQKDKNYDETSNILGEISSDQIYPEDKEYINIIGNYVDENGEFIATKGDHFVLFTFSGNGAKESNYSLPAFSQNTGSILAANIYLEFTDGDSFSTYYTNQVLRLPISYFSAYRSDSHKIISDFKEHISGEIVINLFNSNTYDLSQNFDKIVLDQLVSQDGYLENFNIVAINGTLIINKAEIFVQVSDYKKEYNGEVQTPTFTIGIQDGHGEVTDQNLIFVKYKSQNSSNYIDFPTNAGTYEILISLQQEFSANYQLYYSGSLVDSYTASESFVITAKNVKITVKSIDAITYTGSNIVYEISSEEVEGLVSGQNLIGTLTTNGRKGGLYTFNGQYVEGGDYSSSSYGLTPNIIISNLTINTTSNYIIFIDAQIKIISTLTNFDTSELDGLVYDKTDKVKNGEIVVSLLVDDEVVEFTYGQDYGREATFTPLTYIGESIEADDRSAIFVGEYSFTVTFNIQGATLEEEVIFNISPKTISQLTLETDKPYDANVNLLGDITSTDILIDDIVEINGEYDSANVGTRNISLRLEGDDAFNYVLNGRLALTGEISQRNITLSTKNSFDYDATNPQLTSNELVVGGLGLVSGQNLNGYITLLKSNAGTYDFIDTNLDLTNFNIVDGSDDVTFNYLITFQGQVVINVLNLVLVVSEINLTYDAQIKDIRPYLSFEQALSNRVLSEARDSISISYNITPVVNAGDYEATISSTSTNFNIVYGEDNIIKFNIKKRDLRIDIGKIEYAYNPTSIHETAFSADFLSGLVEGQSVSGHFALTEAGLGVGEYTFGENPGIEVIDLAIFVNGEDILSKNYNLSDEVLGSIKIIPFDLSDSEVWLSEDKITYRAADITSLIIVNFKDANNMTRQITMDNTTFGSFVILSEDESAPINAGKYIVKVSIANYELENDELSLEITPQTIKNIEYNSQREYNGTAYVYYGDSANRSLVSADIRSSDRPYLTLYGYFIDEEGNHTSEVGEHGIVFEFSESDTYPALNYVFDVDAFGEILTKEVNITITHQFAYNGTGNYVLSVANNPDAFEINGLLTGNSLSGQISINNLSNVIGLVSANQINTTMLKIVDVEGQDVSFNYYLKVVSNIEIVKAQINISFEGNDTIFEYNNAPISITPTFTFVNLDGEVLLDFLTCIFTGTKYSSTDAPKNVGVYTLTYSVAQEYENFYEIVSTNYFEFEIIPFEIVLQVGDIPSNIFYKQFDTQDPELRYEITSPFEEIITITFYREKGEDIGLYDIYIEEWDNTNYILTFATGAGNDLFRITKAGALSVVILDTQHNIDTLKKVYDNQSISPVDIKTLDYDANGEILSGTISFHEGVRVGSYKLASANTLTNDHYETFIVTSLVEFEITKKPITLQIMDGDKEFDGSNAFFGTINILDSNGDILDKQQFALSASASFSDIEVNNDILLNLSYTGDSISNYLVTNVPSANITARKVTVTPDRGQSIEYGTQNYEITYQIIDNGENEFRGNLTDEINGTLNVENYDAGSKPILSNLTSQNLVITFTSGVELVITPKALTITSSDNFEKVYDTSNLVIGDLTIQGVIPGDKVDVTAHYDDPEIGTNKTVIFDITGDDAHNYYAENVLGAITERTVTLNYVYVTDNFIMINEQLLQNTSRQSDSLIYTQSVDSSVGALPVPSHEGYTFEGWYLDENFSTPIDDETIIDESIWPIENEEMTAYAKWTIRQFNLSVLVATKVDGTYVVDTNEPGGTVDNVSGLYNYGDIVLFDGKATANDAYLFVGYSYDLLLDIDPDILENGIVIGANDVTIYAKFEPMIVIINLNSNGGVFDTNISGWIFSNANTVATYHVEYNSEIGIELPKATLMGYSQDISLWEDADGITHSLTPNTVMGEEYYPQFTFFAHYNPNEYDLILNANGGYFEGVDTDSWTINMTDTEGRASVISKKVLYDSAVGEIVLPKRDGYEFSSWSIENFGENYIWQSITQGEISANWEELEFKIEITANHGTIEYSVENSSNLTVDTGRVENTSTIITVKTSDRLILSAVSDVGYHFSLWNSDKQDIDGIVTTQVTTSNEFIMDYFVEAIFDANENSITVQVDNTGRGFASANGQFTSSTVSSFEVIIKTGQTLDIVATANEGYSIADWQVSGDGDVVYNLDGTNTDTERTLSGFVGDITVIIYFEPSANDLTIQADAEKGTIHYIANGDEITASGSYTVSGVQTETTFEFDISALHGYKINLETSSWVFETTSLNKGSFNIQSDDGGYTAHITFTGFTSSGTIIVPFKYDQFEIKIGVVLKDDTTFTEIEMDDILSIQNGDDIVLVSTGHSFKGDYLTEVVLSPKDVVKGYIFSSFSISATRIESISSSTGFVGYTEKGDVIYNIIDDLTLYLVYEIQKYDVTYIVNDETMGSLSYGVDGNTAFNRTTSVKFGYTAPAVTAVAGDYFEFDKWIRVVLVDGVYEQYLLNGQPVEYHDETLVVENVTEDCTFMAIFKGVPVSFNVLLNIPDEDVFTDGQIDFAHLTLSSDSTNTNIISSERNGNTISYVISTITGEDIDLIINLGKGYEYEGVKMDPRLIFSIIRSESDVTFSLENLYLSTTIELSIRAKVYEISFNLVGAVDGAKLHALSSLGVVGYSFVRDSLVFQAKTGCNVQSLLYVLNGYKLAKNSYFELLGESEIGNDVYKSSYRGTYVGVSGDFDIDIEILPNVYSVTFDLAYNTEGNRTFTTTISHGETTFNPALTSEFLNPERYSFIFSGYTTINVGTPGSGSAGTYYYFDEGGIYRYVTQNNNVRLKVYGFAGSENATPSLLEGVDYEVTLYATWQDVTYEVELVFVPGFAIDQSRINYNEIFPNSEGRFEIMDNGTFVGISYKPGSNVTVNAPLDAYDGFTYYGWSYKADIISKVDPELNRDECNFTMNEEKVVIYLYYVMDVSASSTSGGTASISSDTALYGETLILTALSEFGYHFDRWLQNSTEITNSTANMNVLITAPANFVAEFEGEKIQVYVNQVENAILMVNGSTSTPQEFRIGDTLTLTISDITYGYEHNGWTSGGYSGAIRPVDGTTFTYIIVPDDYTRGSVRFELSIVAKKIDIRFSIVGDGDCGDIFINNISVAQQKLSYDYDSTLNLVVDITTRYELTSFTLNGKIVTLDAQSSIQMLINQSLGFTADATNEFVATYRKMLWTDVWQPFGGLGTEDSPYLIETREQLSAIAYFINNGIAVEVGATPYADAYYLVNANLSLAERFWVPIGTMENPFNGTFNLNGYDIRNLEPNDWALVNAEPEGMPRGLFGYITENAEFIIGEWNITITFILIFSIIGLLILIVLIVIIIIILRRNKIRKMSETNYDMNIMSQEDLLKAQKAESLKRSKKKNK